jgi:GT2 family glycosyltransferase
VGSGSCLAARRDAALALGGLDEALDLGPALPGGGDHDLLWRLQAAGHRVVYEPDLRARHEHRRDVDDALRQIVGHQRGLVAMLTKSIAHARGRERGTLVAFLLWRLVKPGVRAVRRLVGHDVLPLGTILRMWGACFGALRAYSGGRRVAARRRRAAHPEATA